MKLELGLRRRRRTVWIGLVIVALLTLSHLGGVLWAGSPGNNKDGMATTSKKKQLQDESNDENADSLRLPPIQDMAELFHSSSTRQQDLLTTTKKQRVQRGKPAPSPATVANSKTVTPATITNQVPPSTTTNTAAATATSTTSRPTAAPMQSLPPVPIVQPPPSFHFDLDDDPSDGCTNATQLPANISKIKAQWSDNMFKPQISMDNLMEIVQAGMNPGRLAADSDSPERRIAMCKLRREGNYA